MRTYSFLSSGILHASLMALVLTLEIQLPMATQPIEFEVAASPAPSSSAQPAEVSPPPSPKDLQPTPQARPSASMRPAQQISAATPALKEFDSNDLDQDLDSVDAATATELQDHHQSLSEIDNTIEESEVLAQEAQAAQKEAADMMAAAAAAEKEKSAAEIARLKAESEKAKALAAEEALAHKAKQEAAAKLAHQQELSAAEEKFQAAKLAAIQAAAQATAEHAPEKGPLSASEVRALEELKQMPGNARPEYDDQDRLNNRHGEVVFWAFITKDGRPTSFKMTKSSGHRTLDYKTLKAVRDWRFFPGQEGWVEIPFQWDLKGGPKELGGTLRKRISRN